MSAQESTPAFTQLLDVPAHSGRINVFAALVALLLHAGIGFAIPRVREATDAEMTPTQWLEDTPSPPVPPPVPKEDPPPAPREEPKVLKEPTARVEAAPPPAQAAAVLTQKEDPNAPLDSTDSIVVGNADAYVGGVSSSTGTSPRASSAKATGTGVAGAGTVRIANLSRRFQVRAVTDSDRPTPSRAYVPMRH